MAHSYFQIAINHSGLNKHRVIRGADRFLVEAAAATQRRAWAEQYAKKVALDERRREREDKRQLEKDHLRAAEERTEEAQLAQKQLREVLATALRVHDRIDWTKMMQPAFSQAQPDERPYLTLPPEPIFDPEGWRHRTNFVIGMVSFLAKRAEAAARAEFEASHAKWRERTKTVDEMNARIYAENLRNFEDWQERAVAYEEARAKHNAAVEQSRAAYQALNPDAVLDYCDMVLSRSQYADYFPKEFELDYRGTQKTLVVEYQLPSPEGLPHLESVKYSRAKGEFIETEIAKRDLEYLYGDVLFQVAIRTVHELFTADEVHALEVVIFNGKVRALNVGNGHEEDRCVLSFRTERAAFERINLQHIEPRACFESFGGLAGAKMLDCRGVNPLEAINRSEGRFLAAQDVSKVSEAGFDEWHELVKGISGPQDIRFLRLGTVAALLGFPAEEKYSASLGKALVKAVAARGYGIEPDACYEGSGYRASDEIALFRPLQTEVSDAYPGAAALLRLCVFIAAADEQITEGELQVIRDFFTRNTSLTGQERQRLLVLENYLSRNPEAAGRSLLRLAKRLPLAQRQLVGEVLVCVAGADGVICSAEWQALDRAFTVLELSPGSLEEILRRLGADFYEPTVQESEASTPGEDLPTGSNAPSLPSFTLDLGRVAAIANETAEVIGLLAAVMSEDQPEPAIAPTTSADERAVKVSGWLGTLDVKYHAITARIVTKSAWPRRDFLELAAEFKLMPLAVIDTINEWADEQLGDFLLEGDDPVTVNAAIIPEEQ